MELIYQRVNTSELSEMAEKREMYTAAVPTNQAKRSSRNSPNYSKYFFILLCLVLVLCVILFTLYKLSINYKSSMEVEFNYSVCSKIKTKVLCVTKDNIPNTPSNDSQVRKRHPSESSESVSVCQWNKHNEECETECTNSRFQSKYACLSNSDCLWENNKCSIFPQHVFLVWFGNEMQGKRKAAFENTVQKLKVPIILITEQNIHKYEVPTHPFHKAFTNLSAVGKSDYLRPYLMHFYGGGYADIKDWGNWVKDFNFVRTDPNIWVYGYKELSRSGVACDESNATNLLKDGWVGADNEQIESCQPDIHDERLKPGFIEGFQGKCCDIVKDHWTKLVGNGAFIVKPHTILTKEWLETVEQHLDAKLEELRIHPAPFHRCCHEHEGGYPLRWAELQGEVFSSIQLKYMKHIHSGLSPPASFNAKDYQ